MRGLSAVLFLAALAAAPAAARAGVVVGEGVPFTEGELSAAIAARAAAAPDEVLVEVPPGPASTGRGRSAADVLVTTPAGTWTVALGDARGPSAARLVALHLVDASASDPAAAPPPAPTRVAAAPLDTPPTDDDPADPSAIAAAAPAKPERRITFTFGVGRGSDDHDLLAATWSAELTTARGPWVGGGAFWVQLAGASEQPAVGEPVSMSMAQFRALFGVRHGRAELVGGPHGGMMFLHGVLGPPERMMIGLGVSGRYRIPLRPPGWSLQLSVGADTYRHRVMVESSGMPLASSPRVAYLLNLGFSGVLGR